MTTKTKPTKLPLPPEPGTVYSTDPEPQYVAPGTFVSYPLGADNGRKNLAAALVKAQAECQNVTMNKTNPHFRSRYADLAAVRDAIIPVFNKHGIAIIQTPTTDEFSGFALETRLVHSSGEQMIWSFPLPSDTSKMQAIGSAISYARRYTLSAIAGVASEEDDDGNAATTNTNGGGYPAGRGAGGASSAGGNAPGAGGIVL